MTPHTSIGRYLLGLLGAVHFRLVIVQHRFVNSVSLHRRERVEQVMFLLVFVEPKHAKKHIMVWVWICSCISSWTVICCRGWSSLLSEIPADCSSRHCVDGVVREACSQTIAHWFFWVLLAIIAVTAIWSAFYLNRAMQVFGNTETVPVYYCTFTTMSILGGAMVYNEFAKIELWGVNAELFTCFMHEDVPCNGSLALFLFGIALAFGGVMLITSGRGHKEVADGGEVCGGSLRGKAVIRRRSHQCLQSGGGRYRRAA